MDLKETKENEDSNQNIDDKEIEKLIFKLDPSQILEALKSGQLTGDMISKSEALNNMILKLTGNTVIPEKEPYVEEEDEDLSDELDDDEDLDSDLKNEEEKDLAKLDEEVVLSESSKVTQQHTKEGNKNETESKSEREEEAERESNEEDTDEESNEENDDIEQEAEREEENERETERETEREQGSKSRKANDKRKPEIKKPKKRKKRKDITMRRCSRCGSTLTYVRVKKNSRVCRNCLHIEKIPKEIAV